MCYFPLRETSEASVRYAMQKAGFPTYQNIPTALEYLIQLMESQDDIEGSIIGYAEGARVAASLILEEEQREKIASYQVRVVYRRVAGRPSRPEGRDFRRRDRRTDWIPTCHVIGSNYHYIHWSMCQYNLCDEGHSELFNQGAGGVLPREKQVVTELSEVI